MRPLLLTATIATLLMGLLCLALTPPHAGALPRGFQSPVFAAELVRDAGEIVQVYGTAAQAGRCAAGERNGECDFIAGLRLNTTADFLFIASYVTAFMALGRLIPGRLGTLVMTVAAIAGLADIAENIGMFRAMSEPASDALAFAVRGPSLVKWTALALVWLGLARVFLGPALAGAAALPWRIVEGLAGLGYLLAGVIGLYALLQREALVEPATTAVFLAGFLQLAILWRDTGFLRWHRLASAAT